MIESKVAAGSLTAGLTGIITYALVTYIPAWHSGLPYGVATLLPYVVSVVAGFGGAWLAKHTPRLEEVLKLVFEHQQQTAAKAAAAEVQLHQTSYTAGPGVGTVQIAPGGPIYASLPETHMQQAGQPTEQTDPYAGP